MNHSIRQKIARYYKMTGGINGLCEEDKNPFNEVYLVVSLGHNLYKFHNKQMKIKSAA